MKIAPIMCLAVVLSLTVVSVAAQSIVTGNKLHSQLQADKRLQASGYRTATPTEMLEATAGVGYVIGVADSQAVTLCIPLAVNFNQLVDIVRHYLEAHPAERHRSAADLVVVAIVQKFPCPTPGK